MTSRERLLKVLRGEIPDCVPVAPDTSNMIPAKMTGKPFWDIYLYQDPPIWKAYLDCVKHFSFDSLMDGYVQILFEDLGELDGVDEWTEVIVARRPDRMITQSYRTVNRQKEWSKTANIYYRDNPPNMEVKLEVAGLPEVPSCFEPIEGRKEWPQGEALLKLVKEEMGDHGLVGVWGGKSLLLHTEEQLYDYLDNPEKYENLRDALIEHSTRRFAKLMSLETKPDFICTGGSGTLIFQTPQIFRELGLPIVKHVTSLCKKHGIPSQIHSCGPAKALIKIVAEETDLTVIDPLEAPPMGDCDLAEMKRLYGDKLVLKGNLHTTDVMLRGSVEDVINASKHAIDVAAPGGKFILSTGDQCGRDTPHENLRAIIDTARSYGRYK